MDCALCSRDYETVRNVVNNLVYLMEERPDCWDGEEIDLEVERLRECWECIGR